MLTIECDTHSRGTPERPQYLIFLRSGIQPASECWLKSRTGEDALLEAKERFPKEDFRLA